MSFNNSYDDEYISSLIPVGLALLNKTHVDISGTMVFPHHKYQKYGATHQGLIYNIKTKKTLQNDKITIYGDNGKRVEFRPARFVFECFFSIELKGNCVIRLKNKSLPPSISNINAILPEIYKPKLQKVLNLFVPTVENLEKYLSSSVQFTKIYNYDSVYDQKRQTITVENNSTHTHTQKNKAKMKHLQLPRRFCYDQQVFLTPKCLKFNSST